jgi:hypothetical protein
MKFTIENGTDGACMTLYDRSALPEDYDVAQEDQGAQDILELHEEGKCAVVRTDGDGAHWLHLYVNEPVQNLIKEYIHEHIKMEKLLIPSGILYYTGCEYISNKETELSKKNKHMIATLEIPSGEYKANIYFIQYPDDYIKSYVHKLISTKSRRILLLHKLLGYISIIGVFTAFIVATPYGITGVITSFVPLIFWFAMFWTPQYVKADNESDEILSQLPKIVAELNG